MDAPRIDAGGPVAGRGSLGGRGSLRGYRPSSLEAGLIVGNAADSSFADFGSRPQVTVGVSPASASFLASAFLFLVFVLLL
jgi:hypothetical protein